MATASDALSSQSLWVPGVLPVSASGALTQGWVRQASSAASWRKELEAARRKNAEDRHHQDSKVVSGVVDELFKLLRSRLTLGMGAPRVTARSRCPPLAVVGHPGPKFVARVSTACFGVLQCMAFLGDGLYVPDALWCWCPASHALCPCRYLGITQESYACLWLLTDDAKSDAGGHKPSAFDQPVSGGCCTCGMWTDVLVNSPPPPHRHGVFAKCAAVASVGVVHGRKCVGVR